MTSSIWPPSAGPSGLAHAGAAPAHFAPPRGPRRARFGAWLRGRFARGLVLDAVDLGRLPAAGALLVVARGDRRAARDVARALAQKRADVRLLSSTRDGARAARAQLSRGEVVVARAAGRRALLQLVALAGGTGAVVVPAPVVAPRSGHRRATLGAPLEPRALGALANDATQASALAWRLDAAAARAAAAFAPAPSVEAPAASPIATRGALAWMEAELALLPPAATLVPHERFLVATARAPQIPALLREIGRLREITFRAVGEGTGRALDLDAFDRSYDHLFVWDRRERELIGAYRLAATERILPVLGVQGLYTHTLFRFAPSFFERLGPAIELGRSFVRPEHQRSSSALVLLWKGIARFVSLQPRAHVLFGPVSVSSRYTPWSRRATAHVLSATRGDPALGRLVAPRRPLSAGALPARSLDPFAAPAALSELIAEAEPSRQGLPVLLREYLKLGGRFLAWNVDAAFADALDGLVVVDLLRSERRLLERYMGKAEAAAFAARRRESLSA